jgi:predicted secreted hydrolase
MSRHLQLIVALILISVVVLGGVELGAGGSSVGAGLSARPPADREDRTAQDTSLSLTDMLSGGSTEGYARATEPREFRFPEDHGAHEEFRTEWWYFTGNLTTAGGRRFGYQFTLFRSAVTPGMPPRESDWATRQVYMAHFAVTDPVNEAFHAHERFSRGAAGLAGVQNQPFRAWLEDWQIRGGEDPPPFRLSAAEGGTSIELELEATKPLVLNGDRGLSRKGREEGNASYYYSYTRMATRGTVTVGFKTFEVQGSSWLDREWSTSALEEGQVGWDWFALQLSDGSDLMVYRLRQADGRSDDLSSGTLVAADGSSRSLRGGDFVIEPLTEWTSPATGIEYPSKWRLTVPDTALDLQITPLLPDQELVLSFRYWEGAVTVSGTSAGEAVSGKGYVELTGYE